MLAVKNNNPERVFVPIIPLRNRGSENSFEKTSTITKMASKNPDLLKLISAFELK
ncbi:hypothetical protein [Jiulongibacter sediminis]|jgi:hypothetical protein|uniref:hypothetical protein n=1 Tax=Jiulongibacter sediminis TaxID=1605367 RepID=UPI0026EB0A41|nr:hypothetical protein [Jiulongibacter sediminis]